MHCPKCVRKSLKPYQVQHTDVLVEACPSCEGVWFDADELNQLLRVATKDLKVPKAAQPTRMTCPQCRVVLQAFDYPQTYVEIDMCPKCHGLWLDKQELTEIKVVRRQLERKGKLETHAPVEGFKGDVLEWINQAIAALSE
ncbi:MAG: zf-TFIIB domain-containing protein [Planctomycetota bacterium]